MAPLLLAFTVIPLIELYLLVKLAQIMGFGSTVALVLMTGMLGAALAKAEGMRVLRGFQQAIAEGRVPEDGVVSAVLVLVGGILLVTPGVLTDLCGLLLLVPVTRRALVGWVSRRVEKGIANGSIYVVGGMGGSARGPQMPFGFGSPPYRPGRPGVVDVESRAIHVKSRVIDVESRVVDVEPRVVDVEPRVIDVESRVIDADSRGNDSEPQDGPPSSRP